MAEALFRELVKDRADYEVASAGTGAEDGDLASMHTEQLMHERGHDLARFRSRSLSPELVSQATHIFAMARSHLRSIESMFPQAGDKSYLVSEFAPDDALRGRDISDPFGGPRAGYEVARDALLKILPSVVAYIDQTFDRTSPTT